MISSSLFSFKTITVIGRNVLVELTPRVERVGRVFIPQRAQEVALTGVVRGIGEALKGELGAQELLPTLKQGDRVHFPPHRGTRFVHGGKEWLILKAADLIAVEDEA